MVLPPLRGRPFAVAHISAVVSAFVAVLVLASGAHALPAHMLRVHALPTRAQPSRSATYLYLRGTDTLGTETLAVSDTAAVGVLTMRGQPRFEWTQTRRGQTFSALTLRVFAAGTAVGSAPMQTANIAMQGDSAVAEISGGGRSATQKLASKLGALPLVNSSVLHEVLLASAMRRTNTTTFDLFLTSGGQTLPATLAMRGDTLVVGLAGTEARALFAADGMPSVITTSQGVRVVRATTAVTPGAAAAIGTINYDAPANAPYTAEHVRIPSGRGYDLAATLTKPTGVARMPVVVTISGSGPQERDSRISIVPGYAFFREIADTLGRRGIGMLRFDDRGVGESGGRESAAKATSADFADDVRSVVAWLRARPDIDGARIALAGHSEGGLIAPMVANTDAKLKAIALLAGPAYTGRRVMMFQNRQAIDNAPGLSARQRDSIYSTVPRQLDSLGVATPWIGYFMAHDPIETAKTVRQPVLILQGLTDTQVSPEQADTLAEAFRAGGNNRIMVRTFPATNHLFLPDSSGKSTGYATLKDTHVRKTVLGALADWLVATLK